MKVNRLILLVCMCFFINTAFSQKTMEKPFEKWSIEETRRVLSDSAWAKTHHSMAAAAAADMAQARRSQSDTRLSGQERGRSNQSGGAPPVVIRLHSALPVRQALTRMNQIAAGYEKMNEAAKAEFDVSAKKLLECAICQSHYVVTLTQIPDSSGQFVEQGIFQGMTLEHMKGNVWLANDKGEKRDLVQFIAPNKRGDSAVFFFARADEKGTPFLTPSHSNLQFAFDNNFLTTSNPFGHLVPRRFEFSVSKMKVGENLMF